jgi:hypothetical protein
VRADLARIIEPISGRVSITKFERDHEGHAESYKVWARRQ